MMGSKVLLADDSITIQKVVGIILANEDYELTVVDNGNAALDKAREIKPDVIMLDAIMPGKTGYEVCQEIRRDPQLKDTPLLLMTGAFEPFDEEKARQSGADDFISKPFESQNLIDRISQLVATGKERPAVAAAAPAAAADFVFDEEPSVGEPADFAFAEEPTAEPDVDFDFAEEPVAPVAMTPPAAEFSFAEAPTEVSAADFAFDIEPAAPAAPAFTAAAEPAAVSPADFAFDEEPAFATPAPVPSTAATAAAVSAVSADDDLWGVFDLDEATGGESGAVETPAGAVPSPVAASAFAEDAFGFDLGEAASENQAAVKAPDKWVPVDEQEFSFANEAPAVAPAIEQQFAPDEGYVPAPVQPAAVPVAPAFEQQFAPEEESVPAPVQPAASAAAGATVTLSEAQLQEIVAKLSREVIERIVWEVVPDLAEVMIKEEIRKIREGGAN
ncbi:MAG TPA: response regulator [Geobacteraceae bacterium]